MRQARQTRLVVQLRERRELREFIFSGPETKPDRVNVTGKGKDVRFTYTFNLPLDPGRSALAQHFDLLAKKVKSAEARAKEDSEYAAIEALKQTRESGWEGWKKSVGLPPSVRVAGNALEIVTGHVISYDTSLTPDEINGIEAELHDWLS
jgi:hypothetical protein